jgi:hypothetical protein
MTEDYWITYTEMTDTYTDFIAKEYFRTPEDAMAAAEKASLEYRGECHAGGPNWNVVYYEGRARDGTRA